MPHKHLAGIKAARRKNALKKISRPMGVDSIFSYLRDTFIRDTPSLTMVEKNATILIPDISGFTEFMTSTELTHASHAINFLIDAIVNAVGDEFEVSEIEGDAVLLIKKDPVPSRKALQDICIRIFNAFHYQRKWIQQHTICPCGACVAIINLTLKFIVHYGPLAEIKVGRFIKPSGPEMIVAHRLLKNSINNNEYLLMTEKLLKHLVDSSDSAEMEWMHASEEYASIGRVEYQFALLNELRKRVPEPPAPKTDYRTDNTSYLERPIAANFLDVYMMMMNIPERPQWMPNLKKVEQDIPDVFVGSIHHCTFEDYHAIVSPLRMVSSDEGIMYAESHQIEKLDLSLVYEYVFKNTDAKTCGFAARFMNTCESPIPEELRATLFKNMEQMAERLALVCEKMEASVT